MITSISFYISCWICMSFSRKKNMRWRVLVHLRKIYEAWNDKHDNQNIPVSGVVLLQFSPKIQIKIADDHPQVLLSSTYLIVSSEHYLSLLQDEDIYCMSHQDTFLHKSLQDFSAGHQQVNSLNVAVDPLSIILSFLICLIHLLSYSSFVTVEYIDKRNTFLRKVFLLSMVESLSRVHRNDNIIIGSV